MNAIRPTLVRLEDRLNLSASPLPVLLVISDRQDFHIGGQNQWLVHLDRQQPSRMDGVVILNASMPGGLASRHPDFAGQPIGHGTRTE